MTLKQSTPVYQNHARPSAFRYSATRTITLNRGSCKEVRNMHR